MINVEYKPDVKPIIDAINNLTPWDRNELITYLYWTLDGDSVDAIIEEIGGWVRESSIDEVKMVIENSKEIDVLDEMSDYDIAEYVTSGYFKDGLIREIFNRLDSEEIATNIKKEQIESIINYLIQHYPKEIADSITKILTEFEKLKQWKEKIDKENQKKDGE